MTEFVVFYFYLPYFISSTYLFVVLSFTLILFLVVDCLIQ